jgi:SAM-dependent methyltransferase
MASVLRDKGYSVHVVDGDASNPGLYWMLEFGEAPKPLIESYGEKLFSGGIVTCPVDDPTPLLRGEIGLDEIPHEYFVEREGSTFFRAGKIETILSDGDTRLLDKSVDVILFYGVLPEIEDKEVVLKELHRVLNPKGYLSTRYCFRMKKEKLLPIVEATGLFSLKEQKGHILNFVPR